MSGSAATWPRARWATCDCATSALALDELVLMYGDHAGHAGLRALVAADSDTLTRG